MEKIQTRLIKIGNSRGICLPRHVLDRFDITGKVELVIDDASKQIHIRAIDTPRSGWEECFRAMRVHEDDELLLDDSLDLENDEWTW